MKRKKMNAQNDIKKANTQNNIKYFVATTIAMLIYSALTWKYINSDMPEVKGNILIILSQTTLKIYFAFRFLHKALDVFTIPFQYNTEEDVIPQNIDTERYIKLYVIIGVGIMDFLNFATFGIEDTFYAAYHAALAGNTPPANPLLDLYYRIFLMHMLVLIIDTLPDIIDMIMLQKNKEQTD